MTNTENKLNGNRRKSLTTMMAALLAGSLVATAGSFAYAKTDGQASDPAKFEQFMGTYVGATGPFVSASMWVLATPGAGPVATVGQPPALAADPALATAFFPASKIHAPKRVRGFLLNFPGGVS